MIPRLKDVCLIPRQDFLLYSNHLGLCTEEISEAGEGFVVDLFYLCQFLCSWNRLGNAVQGFTYVHPPVSCFCVTDHCTFTIGMSR